MTLDNYFAQNPKGALAFSGGVDSAYLLWAGIQAGASLRPYFIKTPFQPRFELEDAQRLCKAMGTELTVIEIDILSDSKVASNPPDRCYYCKRRMFALLKERALRDGLQLLLEGTNVSDRVEDRPGMRALAELGVRSPCGNVDWRRRISGNCPDKRGCLLGRSPPTPVWLPGSPLDCPLLGRA